jgi:hypothetical protein
MLGALSRFKRGLLCYKREMFWPIYVYVIASLTIAGSAALNAGLGPAAYAITTSFLFLMAGGGWKASLLWGDKAQKIGGSVVAVLIVALAQWLSSGFSVDLFGHALSGAAWGWIGFVICFVFATRKLGGAISSRSRVPGVPGVPCGALGRTWGANGAAPDRPHGHISAACCLRRS